MIANSIENMAKNHLINCIGLISESDSYDVSNLYSFDLQENKQRHWYADCDYVESLEKARSDLMAWVENKDCALSEWLLSEWMISDRSADPKRIELDFESHYSALMYAVGMLLGYVMVEFHDELLESSSEWVQDHVFTKNDKMKLVEIAKNADFTKDVF